MDTMDEIKRYAEAIRRHERHHIDGGCHAPSGGICPKPEMMQDLRELWGRLADEDPAQYGWAKHRSKIATYLPGGRLEDEIPTILWGVCHVCGSVGPQFFTTGGKATCLSCLEKDVGGQ